MPPRCASRIPRDARSCRSRHRFPTTSVAVSSCSERRAGRRRSTLPVDQRLHVRLEDDADLVAAPVLYEADTEDGALQRLVAHVAIFSRIAQRARAGLYTEDSAAARDR